MDHLTYESKENVEELEGHGPGQAHGNIAWSRALLSSAAVLMPQLSTLHHSNPVPRTCSLAGVGGASKPGLRSVPSGPRSAISRTRNGKRGTADSCLRVL